MSTLIRISLLLGIIFFHSAYAAVPSSPPSSSSAPNGGWFATYFSNLKDNPCTTPGQAIRGYSATLMPICENLFWIRNPSSETENTGNVRINGNLGIGMSPTIRLDVDGQIRIRGGSPGTGRVLTSDANGLGSWSTPNFSEKTCLGSGSGNTCYGVNTLSTNTTGLENIAIGLNALRYNTTGIRNMAIGPYALMNNTTGNWNYAIGEAALGVNTSGSNNFAIGQQALQNLNGSAQNTAVGKMALRASTSGWNNTAIGISALDNLIGGASNNTAIGAFAGNSQIIGNNNIMIGDSVNVPNLTGSNQIRLGNSSITYAGVQVGWTVTSDRRWKNDIQDSVYGLDFIEALRPVSYIRKNNTVSKREYGFIAQDIENVLKNQADMTQGFLTKTDDGYLELRYNDLIAIQTKAIQELSKKQNELESAIKSLQDSYEELAKVRQK